MKKPILGSLILAGVVTMLAAVEPSPPAAEAAVDGALSSKAKRIVVPFDISPTGHQMIKTTIGSDPLRLLIDSGSGGDMLDSATVERLKLKGTDKATDSVGVGGTGGAIRALESVECQIAGQRIKISFSAMDLAHVKIAGGDGGIDGILGSPFLRARHAVLDFGSNTLTYDADPS